MAGEATVDNLSIAVEASASKAMRSLTNLAKRMQKVTAAAREMHEAVGEQTEATQETATQTERTDKEQSSLAKTTSKLAESTKKATGGITKLARAFGRIMLYRALRTIIKNITSSIREGLTNLKDYSETVGTAFAPAVDNLRRHVLLLKNSFATALRPVIEALIPVIIQLVDWFSKLFDFIAQVLSVLTGKVDSNNRYTKAVLSDLTKSNKKAKELRRTLLGFDEINRLDGNTDSGEAQSSGLMFKQEDVSPEAAAVAEKIAKAWEKVKEIIDKIGWKRILEVIGAVLLLKAGIGIAKKLMAIWTALKKIFAVIGKAGIAGVIAALLVLFAFWGDKISDWLEGARKAVDRFFESLKGGSGLANAVADLLKHIVDFVLDAVSTIARIVYKLVHGDLDGALKDLVHLVFSILRFLVDIVFDVLNVVLGLVEDVVYALSVAFVWAYNNGIAPVIDWVYTAVKNIGIFLHNTWVDIKIGFWTLVGAIIDAVNWALGKIESVINAAIDTYNFITDNDVQPISLKVDSTSVDAKIEELRNTKLDPINETIEVATRIKQPDKIKLQLDATVVKNDLTALERRITGLGNSLNRSLKDRGAVLAKDSLYTARPYASGGYPSMGSYFLAGERGPEYVGSINGRTGVYNTDQMSSALYTAMVAALATMPQSGGGDIYLDGEVLYRNTVRRNNNLVRSTGRSALIT